MNAFISRHTKIYKEQNGPWIKHFLTACCLGIFFFKKHQYKIIMVLLKMLSSEIRRRYSISYRRWWRYVTWVPRCPPVSTSVCVTVTTSSSRETNTTTSAWKDLLGTLSTVILNLGLEVFFTIFVWYGIVCYFVPSRLQSLMGFTGSKRVEHVQILGWRVVGSHHRCLSDPVLGYPQSPGDR